MAIYHLHVKNISRGEGRSAVAAAAYRAGQTLPNEAEEKESAFGGRRGVVHVEICAPVGAPAWMTDRARLWNAVEAAELRKDARLAKEIEFALPRELSRSGWIEAARKMAEIYVRQGLVADFAVHDDGTGHNPHVHLLLTTRIAGPDGLGAKLRTADGVAFVHEARAHWAKIANAALAGAGAVTAIEHRSHKATGNTTVPSVHRGPDKAERRQRRWEARMTQREQKADDQPEPVARNERPVPGPDGRPITPREQDSAERAMLTEMEREKIDPATEWWLQGEPRRSDRPAPEVEPNREQWWEPDR